MIGGMNFPLVITDRIMAERRELERAASAISEEEFRAFYERTARPLWAYLSRLTGDRSRADDILQEAYYRFYRAGATYESEEHRRNSLFRIATNIARDLVRREKRYEEVPLEDDAGEKPLPQTVISAPADQAMIRTDVGRALLQLEPMQRELLWLAYGQGASHEEIADVLGLRAISIRTLLFRARKKLAALLGEPREATR